MGATYGGQKQTRTSERSEYACDRQVRRANEDACSACELPLLREKKIREDSSIG